MRKWLKKNWKTLFSGIGTGVVVALIGQYFTTKDGGTFTSKENTNSGQQQAVSNQGDVNQQWNIQNQGVPFDELEKGYKNLGRVEHRLEITELEKQKLQKQLELYRKEDKDIREALVTAENKEKYELTAEIMYEHIEGHIAKDKALKLSDMVNKAYWKDLKDFINNKSIKIDKNNQSLVFSGIFEAQAEGGGYRARYNSPAIGYKLTADGEKLYEIANKYISTITTNEN